VPSVAALAPSATPRAIVERLSAEMAKAVRHPDSVQRFASLGIEPVGSTPEAHAAQMKSDLQLFQQAVRVSGVKPE
jgi:tripartite-type tricarboxylate transporter receptor subunit TctC